jgi:hypothetical protein
VRLQDVEASPPRVNPSVTRCPGARAEAFIHKCMGVGMRPYVRLLLAALMSIAVLGAVVDSASATRTAILNWEKNFRFRAGLKFVPNSFIPIQCDWDIGMRFTGHIIEKRTGALLGRVESVTVTRCSGGTVSVLREALPWTLQYASFTGTLPNIASYTLLSIGAAILILPNEPAVSCLARTTEAEPMRIIATTTREAGGLLQISTIRVDETATIRLGGGFLCGLAGTGRVEGSGTIETTEGRPPLAALI